MSNTKILSQKTVLKSILFDVDEFEVEKDGHTYTHHNVVEDDVSMVIPLTDNGEVYLISQYRYLHDKVMLEGVAGFLEGKTPLETAKKELKEEAGLTAKKWTHLSTVQRAASVIQGNVHIFLAQDLTEESQDLEEFEEIEVVKVPLDEIKKKIANREITIAGFIAAIFLLDEYLKNGQK